ncbi:MAG: cell division protein ZipA C-terminal FtsZ-binding domain-containing protein [Rhodocyclaceae bacterium]|nr:cell division protein ZipA C-terminal FtsZ-binding domain-containing protein [Rhodocyclaceae bacterium]
MSELQIAMIGFGVLLVAVVWGYNLWQTRKQRRMAQSVFPDTQPDVLMAGRSEPEIVAVPREPTLMAPHARNPGSLPPTPRGGNPQTSAWDGPAPTFEEVAPRTAVQAEDSTQTAPVPAEWADARADCLLKIEFVAAVPVAKLWAEHAGWSRLIDKPVQWLGLDEKSGRWRSLLPQDAGVVQQLAVALQLVDRKGPVSEVTLAAFLDGIRRLAQRFSGLVELPEPAPLLAAAGELDAFCAAVDLQLALHVLPRQGSLNEMAGAQLKPVIDACGLKLEGERFVAMDVNGAEIFALSCQSATGLATTDVATQSLTALSLALDVPRVADGAAAFDRLIDFARQCAAAVGGQLADANKNPLSDATSSALRVRIGELQAQMAQNGIPAGEVRALRLFA